MLQPGQSTCHFQAQNARLNDQKGREILATASVLIMKKAHLLVRGEHHLGAEAGAGVLRRVDAEAELELALRLRRPDLIVGRND